MGVDISYMGTKRVLAPLVGDVIASAKDGIFLDAFAGMCSVAEQVGPTRQVWVNDAQVFAANVGEALFVSADEPPDALWVVDRHHELYIEHVDRLRSHFERAIALEKRLLEINSYDQFCGLKARLQSALRKASRTAPERAGNLFCRLYADSYIGLFQAIEVDAIVHAIDRSKARGLISEDQRRWMLIALGRAMLRSSTSTGHFAQYLKPNSRTFVRYQRQRSRDIWKEWASSIDEVSSVGSASWRRKNRVFNQDCLGLLAGLKNKRVRPSVVYADPPYTDDQYSRFYHLLETLILYDYPEISGIGRYRSSRFQTSFSLKSAAANSIESLISTTAALDSDLVLSYPTNGLAYQVGVDVLKVMRRYYNKADRVTSISHRHSTFGASNGAVASMVKEQIFWARQ